MKRAIWKFEIPIGPEKVLSLPAGYIVRHVGTQSAESVMIWVEVDPSAIQQRDLFVVVGTGQEFDATRLDFIGTTQAGAFVWHLYRDRSS